MSLWMLRLADYFFLTFHTAFTLFNVFGWAIPRTRRLNLWCLLLTAFSWLGIGAFTTIGYCPLTDWHWRILYRLGEGPLPRSYVQYVLLRLLGIEIPADLVDTAVAALFAVALVISVVLNLRDRRRTAVQ